MPRRKRNSKLGLAYHLVQRVSHYPLSLGDENFQKPLNYQMAFPESNMQKMFSLSQIDG